MKTWQVALIGVILVAAVAFAIQSKKAAMAAPTSKPVTGPSTSNDIFGSLFSLGINYANSKITSPPKTEPLPTADTWYPQPPSGPGFGSDIQIPAGSD